MGAIDDVVPYVPPREAAYLGQRQRRAVDEMIRLLALTPEFHGSAAADQTDAIHESQQEAVAAYDAIAQQKAAEALRSDYAPAASPHEQPDPHNDESSQNDH